jgi:hypothetical protein
MFGVTPDTQILDVGGHVATWTSRSGSDNVTLVNLSKETFGGTECRCVVADARRLPFRDQSFDIAFSNSVIEHLGEWEEQQAFAGNKAGGRYFYVQTPNRWFFMEPHLITPFIHFFPRNWQRRLLRNFTVWGFFLRPTAPQCDAFLEEVRLRTKNEVRDLFRDGLILSEKFAGFTKSFMAVRLPAESQEAGVFDRSRRFVQAR